MATAQELANHAAELLILSGFVLCSVSKTTESRYYRWPDRPYTIRVSTHAATRKAKHPDSWKVKGKITINGVSPPSPDGLRRAVAGAIGNYFLRTALMVAAEEERAA